jgi:hypothetical protein
MSYRVIGVVKEVGELLQAPTSFTYIISDGHVRGIRGRAR